ncbi:preprotein translocase subunit SecE [Tissierella creatinini]|nr:preprotein translocase subunit SecE [Tissierella creatinini]TJX61052.1 preprotein translocase subunit SecE [Soehngenia saccharolytica]
MNTYIRGVKAELKKVIWPSKKDLINYTGVVILLSTIIALIVYVIDLGINQILSLIIQ